MAKVELRGKKGRLRHPLGTTAISATEPDPALIGRAFKSVGTGRNSNVRSSASPAPKRSATSGQPQTLPPTRLKVRVGSGPARSLYLEVSASRPRECSRELAARNPARKSLTGNAFPNPYRAGAVQSFGRKPLVILGFSALLTAAEKVVLGRLGGGRGTGSEPSPGQMSFATASAGAFAGPDVCSTFAPDS